MRALQLRDSRRVAQAAYTLPELLVATFVLGIFVISLYAGFGSGFGLLRLVREDARATQIIQQKIETLRLCSWSQLTNFPRVFQEKYDPLATTNDPLATIFNGTISLTTPDFPTAYATNLRLVTITVYWTNCDGGKPVAHTTQSQTQLARYGLQNDQWGVKP